MGKTFIAGLLFIGAAVVTILLSAALDLEIESVFFGLAIGAAMAFVNDKSTVGDRLGAFSAGLVVTMAGYLIRVLALNESLVGQIIFAMIVGILITVICGLTSGRLPLWAGFMGVALVIGSYEASFQSAPQDLATNLFSNVSMAIVPMAIAFLFGMFMKPDVFVDLNEPGEEPEESGPLDLWAHKSEV